MRSLLPEQIEEFKREGVLVVEDILSPVQLEDAKRGLAETLAEYGIDEDNLEGTAQNLVHLSSTNGSGGVLDIFYPSWKLEVATNPNLFHTTCQLWAAAYCHENEYLEHLEHTDRSKWHPYGSFDPKQGFMYMDRIGYRIPTTLAEKLGAELIDANQKKKKNKTLPLQRSLTPHLDCCPTNMYSDKRKWRPIQCFVSLTDNTIKNTGGFEAAPGFHRTFENWAATRPPTAQSQKYNGSVQQKMVPAPCLGEYTHIRPTEDRDVMSRIQHIPVRAGSAVFWDNRIPHANAYRNDMMEARAVVYCSFLPNVEINKQYVRQQLANFLCGKKPTDQWINVEQEENEATEIQRVRYIETPNFTALGRKLMNIDPW